MGDPACWMHEVCMDCGILSEERGPGDPCPHCGAEADDVVNTSGSPASG